MQFFNGFNGDTSIEVVAAELHRTAEEAVTGLGVPALEERDDGSLTVPDTDLEVTWGTAPAGAGGTERTTTLVRARLDDGAVSLLAVSAIRPDLGTPVREVQGFRGAEPKGDYHIGTLRVGLVECKLGSLGVNGGEPVDEPVGTTKERLPRRLANLSEADITRLGVVDRGIREGIDAIGMIMDGNSAADVLEMMDRAPLH